MTKENIAGYELALTIINEGGLYARCQQVARDATRREQGHGAAAQCSALAWLSIALDGARRYERQFGSYGASCFADVDILAAAIEIAEHFHRELTETTALAAKG